MRGVLLNNEPLAKYTSWRVGGPAEQLYFPADRQDLSDYLASFASPPKLYWLGLGSNLLVRDGGLPGVVISTCGELREMHNHDSEQLYVEAGVPCAHVAKFSVAQGLTGAEFLAGIPGTLGGALKMNAGAFGGETWNLVASVEMIDASGRVTSRTREQFEIGYRSVTSPRDEWFLAAILRLKPGDAVAGEQKIKALLKQRGLTQPTNKPSCGSVFKNPEHDFAARLIETSGLAGYRLGGACVSKKHTNFIENDGNASAAQIEELIEYVQQQVLARQQVYLELEVCRVGVRE